MGLSFARGVHPEPRTARSACPTRALRRGGLLTCKSPRQQCLAAGAQGAGEAWCMTMPPIESEAPWGWAAVGAQFEWWPEGGQAWLACVVLQTCAAAAATPHRAILGSHPSGSQGRKACRLRMVFVLSVVVDTGSSCGSRGAARTDPHRENARSRRGGCPTRVSVRQHRLPIAWPSTASFGLDSDRAVSSCWRHGTGPRLLLDVGIPRGPPARPPSHRVRAGHPGSRFVGRGFTNRLRGRSRCLGVTGTRPNGGASIPCPITRG
jgi:hypothetical protein